VFDSVLIVAKEGRVGRKSRNLAIKVPVSQGDGALQHYFDCIGCRQEYRFVARRLFVRMTIDVSVFVEWSTALATLRETVIAA
jgi:hypothetical protein